MKSAIKIIAFGLLLFVMVQCTEGPAGPVGPAGLQGSTGPAGPGAVINDFSVQFNTFQGPTTSGYYFRNLSLPNANLGPNDVVLMYRRAQSSATNFVLSAMPYDDYFKTDTGFLANNFSFDVVSNNTVTVYVRRSDGGLPMGGTVSLSFRAVVIRGIAGKIIKVPANLPYEEAVLLGQKSAQ